MNTPSQVQDISSLKGLAPSDVGENLNEWGAVEWAVQCIYRSSSSVRLSSLWAVEHPELNRAFDASLSRVSAEAPESSFTVAIEASELPPRVPIRRVAQHGFAGIRAFQIHLGNRQLPSPQALTRRSGTDFFEIVLCRVRLGHNKVLDDARSNATAVTGKFDSYLLPNAQKLPAVNVHPLLCSSFFSHRYLIRDAQSQLLPIYVARVQVSSSPESGSTAGHHFDGRPPVALLQGLPCDLCETNCATLWCTNDRAKLCKHCDYQLHEQEKLGDPDEKLRNAELRKHVVESSLIIRQRHIRVPINERPGIDKGSCYLIDDRDEAPDAAWWDRKLKVAISDIARSEQYPINTDESRLQPLFAAYGEAVSADSNKTDPSVATKEFLLSLLYEIDSLISQLERESAVSVDTRIKTVHGHAMQKLMFHSEKTLSDLLSIEEGVQDHLNMLKWAREVGTPRQDIMVPKKWLEMWVEHYRLLKELSESIERDISHGQQLASPAPMVEKCSMRVELSVQDSAFGA